MSLLFKYTVSGKNFTQSRRNGKSVVVETPITFEGDVQPLSSREIVSLTSGRLSTGMVVVLSETELVVPVEGDPTKSKGTYVLFEGKWYECVTEASSNTPVPELADLNHYEYNAEYRGLDNT